MEITFENLPKAVSFLAEELSEIKRLLLERKPEQTQPDTDQLLTIQQAAKFLSLSVTTLYGLVSKSEIPVSKPGKRLYFSKQELTEWIRAGRKKTNTEIENEAETFIISRKKK